MKWICRSAKATHGTADSAARTIVENLMVVDGDKDE